MPDIAVQGQAHQARGSILPGDLKRGGFASPCMRIFSADKDQPETGTTASRSANPNIAALLPSTTR
jgi:hypothetical protein